MKLYISVDIEGCVGVSTWEEASPGGEGYPEARAQMTREAVAACRGGLAAGATEIVVKDAHKTGRNLLARDFPEQVHLIRGWSGHPFGMVQELDQSFDAVVMIGYHAKAGDAGNPLAHTLSSKRVTELRLNGAAMSEFRLHQLAAASVGVPVVFLSGDAQIVEEVHEMTPGIGVVAVKACSGESTQSMHPDAGCEAIAAGVEAALSGNLSSCRTWLPERCEFEIDFKDQGMAYRAAWYPGAEATGARTVAYTCEDYFDGLRFLGFCA